MDQPDNSSAWPWAAALILAAIAGYMTYVKLYYNGSAVATVQDVSHCYRKNGTVKARCKVAVAFKDAKQQVHEATLMLPDVEGTQLKIRYNKKNPSKSIVQDFNIVWPIATSLLAAWIIYAIRFGEKSPCPVNYDTAL